MDKISADLLDRIKTAVIQKLRELERYVDNELPDYIMILLANKRTLAHMQKDLFLFLKEHTVEFTLWLFDMVARLKKSSSSVEASASKPEKAKEIVMESNSVEEDADVLNYDLGDQEGDLLYQDDSSQSSKPLVSASDQKTKAAETKTVDKDAPEKPTTANVSESKKLHSLQPVSKLSKKPILQRDPMLQAAAAYFDEYDPTRPEFSSGISSVVHSIKKSHPKPPVFQTNKLLLRAVDDATKSINDNKNIYRYNPTPIKMLASVKNDDSGSKYQNLVNVKIDPDVNLDPNAVLNYPEESMSDTNETELQMDSFSGHYDKLLGIKSIHRTIRMPSEQDEDRTETPTSADEHSLVEDASFNLLEYSDATMEQEELSEPHFIVTLDGVDVPSLKRKIYDSEESMDAEDSYLADEEFDVSPKKQKVGEKCKYWPSCRNEDCTYHHPTVPCKTFPDCTFGDKCLYIHPNCKFDSWCSRKGCPYTHATKRISSYPLVASKRPVKVQGFKTVCKFYPKCTVKNCAFIHPKLCRFGTKCRLPTCQFTHVSIPSRNQMKWKATVSEDV